MTPVCLCCGECRVTVKSAPLVIPGVFNVQSDVFSRYGVPARKEKLSRDIQECLPPCAFVLHPPLKAHCVLSRVVSHEERNISVVHTDALLGGTSTAWWLVGCAWWVCLLQQATFPQWTNLCDHREGTRSHTTISSSITVIKGYCERIQSAMRWKDNRFTLNRLLWRSMWGVQSIQLSGPTQTCPQHR